MERSPARGGVELRALERAMRRMQIPLRRIRQNFDSRDVKSGGLYGKLWWRSVDGGSAGRDPCVERLRLLHDLAASLLGLRLPPGTSESQEGPQGQAFRLGTGENARRARGLSIRFDVRHELVDLRPVIPLASCP